MNRINTVKQIKVFSKKHWNYKLIILLLLVALVLTIIVCIPTRIAYADQEDISTRSYKTIEIKPGDSLWSIAAEHYTKECESMTDYIYLIKRCNSLYDDNITAGCHLILPYYE